jgi:hypothetical protein
MIRDAAADHNRDDQSRNDKDPENIGARPQQRRLVTQYSKPRTDAIP